MHDGPEDGPRRSRRTRTDDAPPASGEVSHGPDDDVLDRFGLRDASPSRDDAPARRREAAAPPWPPRSRRRAGDRPPPVETTGAGPDGAAPGRTNGHDDGDTPGRAPRRRIRTGLHSRNGRTSGESPTNGSAPRDPDPESGVDRTDALRSVAGPAPSGRAARRRRGATDSRHTEVMPVTPRRRARDDDPEPPAGASAAPRPTAGPSAPVRPASVPQDPGPPPPDAGPPNTGPPNTAAAPGVAPNGAGPNGVTPNGVVPNGSAPNGAAPNGVAPNTAPPVPPPTDGRAVPSGDTPAGTSRTSPASPATRRATPEADTTGERAATPPPVAPRSSGSGHGPAGPSAAVAGAAPADARPSGTVATPDTPVAPGDEVEAGAAPETDEPPPPAGPGHRLLRIGAALVAVVVLAACAYGFASHQTIEDGIRTVAALDPDSDAVSQRATQTGDENVLVLGLPADRAGVPEAARADTAVLIHLPSGGAPAVTLGFPPTLEVARPPCQRWDPTTGAYGDTVPAESRIALSAAYDVGGPKCAVDVAQQVTGLVVTRFVAFDLSGVNELVGAVRGVGVCAERPVVDRALGPVVTRPGDTVLGGSEAERFSAATGVDDTSPIDRVRRQQRVLSAVLENALSTGSLLDPGAADRIARALPGALTVDGAEAEDVLVLSRSLSRATGEDAAPPFVSVPVNEQPNTRGHLELNRGDSSDLFSALQKHEPLPPAFTVPAQRSGTLLLPQGTVVDVLNAAGRSGLADEIATALRAQGYAIGAVGDAPPTPDTVIRFSPDRADASGVLGTSVPSARPETEPGRAGTLKLVLGGSFPGASAISAPAPPPGPSASCG